MAKNAKSKAAIFFMLFFESDINGGDAKSLGQRLHVYKPNFAQNIVQLLAEWEYRSRFRQVAVSRPVFREKLPNRRQYIFIVEIIALLEREFCRIRCFEDHENPARTQHAQNLAKPFFKCLEIADA